MTNNDFGVAFPDPRNVHISHLDAAQPENQLLVNEGVLQPSQKWHQRYRFTTISLASTAVGIFSIILGIVISFSMFNDSGQPLGALGLLLFGAGLIISLVGMFKDQTIGPPCFAFLVALLPLASIGVFTWIVMSQMAAYLQG